MSEEEPFHMVKYRRSGFKGTEKLWEDHSYDMEHWCSISGFDPIEEIGQTGYGGYDWSEAIAFRNKNGSYAIISGSGCSCNSLGEFDPQIFPNMDELIAHVRIEADKERKHLEEHSYSEETKYVDMLHLLETRRNSSASV